MDVFLLVCSQKPTPVRFTGIINAKLDDKGRVFLPSDFRKQLGNAEVQLVLKRDIHQPCLVVYPYAVWEKDVDELRSRLNRWQKHDAMILRQFLADAEVFSLDKGGRFILPRRLVEICGIGRSVSFVGVDDRIEIWAEEAVKQNFMSDADLSQSLEKIMTIPF